MQGWFRWLFGGVLLVAGLAFLAGRAVYPPLAALIWEPIVPIVVGCGVVFRLDEYARNYLYRAPDCGMRVRRLLSRVADDPHFQDVAGLSQAEAMASDFRAVLGAATVCYSSPFQGGYANLVPNRGIVLALSPLHLRAAAAAHELLHLARHISGQMPFPPVAPNIAVALSEEGRVWYLTFCYARLRCSFELLIHFAVLGGAVWLALDLLYRIC